MCDELKKLLEEKDRIIEQQKELIDRLNEAMKLISPSIPSNSDTCIDGGPHDYPNPWFGVIPPHCKKCGKQAYQYSVTCSSVGCSCGGNC